MAKTRYSLLSRVKREIYYNSILKKSTANTKGNVQQWYMFESPVQTKSISSPILATMFLLQSPKGARWHDWSRSAVLA